MSNRDLTAAIEEELLEDGEIDEQTRIELEAFRMAFDHKPKWNTSAITKPVTTLLPTTKVEQRKEKRVFFPAYKEWKKLQKELRALPLNVEEDLERVHDALTGYRLISTGLSYKTKKVDDQVWVLYRQIITEYPGLKRNTFKRPLFLRSRKWLWEVWKSWQLLVKQQKQLLDLLSKAPKALEFYDKMCILREQQQIERELQAERSQRIAEARKVVEAAIHKIKDQNRQGDRVTEGSRVLKVADAVSYWDQRLMEILEAEQRGTATTDKILTDIHRLKDIVHETPVLARGVSSVEGRFSQLIASHDMLVNLGKAIIPQEEIARATIMMNNEIPQYWATGDFDELDRALQSLDTFISYYYSKVENELSLAEKRRPGLTRALVLNSEMMSTGFPQLITLARAMINAVDSRDRFMAGHSEKVAQFAQRIAKRMNWSESDLEALELGALLHDVGKLSIPEEILTKSGPLTPHEWTIIQMHPYYSAQIVQPIKVLSNIIPWVYHHQEHWDGSGYPDRISKREIPLGASIISLAEAFAAMTTDMPNRQAMTIAQAMDIVKREKEKQFHPEVVEAFTEVMSD
ncbi:MAG: HD domain-containing protein [Anaerolineales bacterium]|nr:HD domain-containing protein [Anaerolineales bacterium]